MSQDGPKKEDSPQKTVSIETGLEIIPESKKEDSPDRLPLQPPVLGPAPQEIVIDPQTARVLAACELPVPVKPESQPPEAVPKLPLVSIAGPEPEKLSAVTPPVQPVASPIPGKDKSASKSVKHGPKSISKTASRKNSHGGGSVKNMTQKPAKESLYDKVLKEYHAGKKKSSPKTATAKTPKPPQSQSQSQSMADEGQKALFFQLRESLLAMQKKDAVTRQTVEKLQKEKRALEDEKKRKEGLIAKCEKTRATDGCTIAKQEEIIAKLRIDQQANAGVNTEGIFVVVAVM